MKKLILFLVMYCLMNTAFSQVFSILGNSTCRYPLNGQDPILLVVNDANSKMTYFEIRYPTNWAPRNTTDGTLCNPCIGSLTYLQTDANGFATFTFNNDPNAVYIGTQNANGWTLIPGTYQFGLRKWGENTWVDIDFTVISAESVITTTDVTTTTVTTTTTKVNNKKKK